MSGRGCGWKQEGKGMVINRKGNVTALYCTALNTHVRICKCMSAGVAEYISTNMYACVCI